MVYLKTFLHIKDIMRIFSPNDASTTNAKKSNGGKQKNELNKSLHIKRIKHNLRKIRNLYREKAAITEDIYKLSIEERVALLFDLWAENDNYGKMMKNHTIAIKKAFARINDLILPESFKDNRLCILDPFIGNGDVTAFIVRTIASEYRSKSQNSDLLIDLYINDISRNMLDIAIRKLNRLKSDLKIQKIVLDVRASNINFLNDVARNESESIQKPKSDAVLCGITLGREKFDLVIISQVLDLLKGIETKNKALTLAHDYLKIGGHAIVIGEDPARFTLEKETDILIALIFETIFDPFDKIQTENEIKRVRNGRLNIIGDVSERIDDVHSIFIKIAKKIYKPSESSEAIY